MHLIGRDGVHFQQAHKRLHVCVAFRQLIRRFVSQPGTPDAVNVVHQQRDILLGVGIQALAPGKHIANELVVLLNVRLLPGGHGIAVEDAGPHRQAVGLLQVVHPLELAPVIREDDGKEPRKDLVAQAYFQEIEYALHGITGSVRHQEQEHDTVPAEDHGQQALALLPDTFYRIH